jgi:hypothetical protein
MRSPCSQKNATESEQTEKAPRIVAKRIREAILDEVFKPRDQWGSHSLIPVKPKHARIAGSILAFSLHSLTPVFAKVPVSDGLGLAPGRVPFGWRPVAGAPTAKST